MSNTITITNNRSHLDQVTGKKIVPAINYWTESNTKPKLLPPKNQQTPTSAAVSVNLEDKVFIEIPDLKGHATISTVNSFSNKEIFLKKDSRRPPYIIIGLKVKNYQIESKNDPNESPKIQSKIILSNDNISIEENDPGDG